MVQLIYFIKCLYHLNEGINMMLQRQIKIAKWRNNQINEQWIDNQIINKQKAQYDKTMYWRLFECIGYGVIFDYNRNVKFNF